MLGDYIREFRLNKGHTLREFAKIVGVNYVTLSSVENNARIPSIATLNKLALITGKSVQSLRKMVEK